MRHQSYSPFVFSDMRVLKFDKTTLTYTVTKFPRSRYRRSLVDQQQLKDTVRADVEEALEVWSRVSKLEFDEVRDEESADLKISFETGNHGDGYIFDGPGMTLAHAFFPKNGRIHFDDDEYWCYNTSSRCGK